MAAEFNDEKMLGDVIISSKDLQGDQEKEGNHPSAATTDPNSCLKIFLNMGKNSNNKNTEELYCRNVLDCPALEVFTSNLCTTYKM